MKKISIIICISLIVFLFYAFKFKKNYTNDITILSFVKETYIDKDSMEIGSNGKRIEKFIGVFPSSNDTISIYKLNNDATKKTDKFSFWSKKERNNHSIIFYSSEGNNVKITFEKNKIIVDNDIYTLNDEYFKFLKKKILDERSILDLAFFLKDGYGDYAKLLEPLNKNWRNQKENNTHRIITAKIKNKNNQTDNQYFEYQLKYKYKKNGLLESIAGGNYFDKVLVEDNLKYLKYSINRSINERVQSDEVLYKNKKTLFDSTLVSWERYSDASISYFVKFQYELKCKKVDRKPKNIEEAILLLKI